MKIRPLLGALTLLALSLPAAAQQSRPGSPPGGQTTVILEPDAGSGLGGDPTRPPGWTPGNNAPATSNTPAAPAPEPGTIALLLSGTATAAWFLYRRRR